jgi:ketosteroid isomerase-like protein
MTMFQKEATFEQGVETLRGVYEAFNRRDIDGLLEGFDPDVVVDETEDLAYAALLLRVLGPRFVVLSGGYRGREEVRRLFETVWEISEWFLVEPEEFVEVDEQIIVVLRLHARAKDSGAEGEARTAHLWTIRNGKGARLQVFPGKAEALEAARRGG